MSIITRVRRWFATMRCDGCDQRVKAVFHFHGIWRCNPCIIANLKSDGILRRLERDGILKIVKES